MSDTVAIPSTGQTYADLVGFEQLYKLYSENKNTSTEGAFRLPALTYTNYQPDTHNAINLSFAITAIILSTFFLVCRLSTRYLNLNRNNAQFNARRLLFEDCFLVAAYVSVHLWLIPLIVVTLFLGFFYGYIDNPNL